MNPVKIYDHFAGNKKGLWISLALLTILLALSALRLDFDEDISDFLPLGTSDREAMSVYQNVSGANGLYILFSNTVDEDYTTDAVDCFAAAVSESDAEGWCRELTTRFDMEAIQNLTDFVYDNIPFFLTEADYSRMDSLLAVPDYIPSQLSRDRQLMMLPSGGLITSSVSRDPLALFTPVISDLNSSDSQLRFEMYDGYIFTPDMSRAIAMLNSPFGNSETEKNTQLLNILNNAVERMQSEYPDVSVHIIGGPEIAVGNSKRIKTDSIIAITLSVVLIVLLLAYSFHSFRNIVLIFLSIGWGWLFAVGGISLFADKVSIIVIGLSSVILGIAVNYPLHLIAHIGHKPQVRDTLREISAPLVIGNITTVGAFLALVPIKSTALHDLGIFASLLLAGTILFVLVYLPHMVKSRSVCNIQESRLIDKIADISPEKNRIFVSVAALLTVILAVAGRRTGFDPDIAGINYMTEEQKADVQYFQDMFSDAQSGDTSELYVLSAGKTYDDAAAVNLLQTRVLDSLAAEGKVTAYQDVRRFIVPRSEQEHRLSLWKDFVSRHQYGLTAALQKAASANGFAPSAFSRFNSLVEGSDSLKPRDINSFPPITEMLFTRNLTRLDETGLCYVVNVVNVRKDCLDEVRSHLRHSFHVEEMNCALSQNLSDSFNYIGWACSLIVFLFLWFSFGRIELAVISFLPMAVSWLWILGIMGISGIRFNIVNVILATFIFGQGDDYTIFMTEGCQYEYAYRRPILASYKSSIFKSALIMLIGIGTLITARHPAMRSLAEVTIIGMLSVVLMAYLIPPLLFRWLTTKNGVTRRYPVTLRSLFCGVCPDPVSIVRGRYLYKGKEIQHSVGKSLRKYDFWMASLDLRGKKSVTLTDNGYGERALLLAYINPGVMITVIMPDDDRRRVAEVSAKDFVANISFINE